MKDMDTRLITNEKACEFVAKEHEQSKTEMKAAKGDMKNIKQTCEKLEREANSMKEKMVDLESRSMRENLMFYGIAEQGKDEDCEQLVKNVCKESLKIATADSLLFDRAHRVGTKSGSKVRPIVVKFHYYHERELVRKRSFDYGEALKGQNLGIGAQLPKQLRDGRRPFYPAMRKAQNEGKNVKFVGAKLFIEGEEYKGATGGAGPTPMEG